MKKKLLVSFYRFVWSSCFCLALISCANRFAPLNLDYLVGKSFTDLVTPKFKHLYPKVRETDVVEEYEWRRNEDGCILIFGVRKQDAIIEYWRVDSGPGTCYLRGFTV